MLKKDVNKLLVEQRKHLRAAHTTRGTIDKLLVDERKKMRIAQKESKFKQRTLAIYKGQAERAKSLDRALNYTLEDFRGRMREQLDLGLCPYCGGRITVNSFVCDHPASISQGGEFVLSNTVACDKSCNWQKGLMDCEQFDAFNKFLNENLPDIVVRDIRMRLSTGGKWAGR
jgi:hypothetical protein